MRTKVLAGRSILQMTENRAQCGRVSGQAHSSHSRIGPQDRRGCLGWFVTSHLYLVVMTALVLVSLAGCSSGNSAGSMGGDNPPPPPNSAPSISSITPQNATVGSAGLTVTVNGSGFVSTSTVNWNGTSLVTTGSGTQLTATVTTADLATVGLAQVTVVNSAADGGTSGPVGFIVNGTPGFVYVANSASASITTGSVSAFSIDPNTGSLNPVPGSPFPAGTKPTSMAADPSGRFLYEANDLNGASSNELFAFTINSSTGALTPIQGSPFASGADTLSVSVDPTGKFLYTADFGGDGNNPAVPNSISQFSIDGTTGALSLVSQAACLSFGTSGFGLANYVATDPAAGFLFASNPESSICSFSISQTGTLQPVAGSPFALSTNALQNLQTFPRSVAVDPFGKFLYTANYDATADVSAFSIAPGAGTLTQLSGSPYSIGANLGSPTSLVADPLGRFLWVVDSSVALSGFSINASTGALSGLAGFPLLRPDLQIAINLSGNSSAIPLAVDPSGTFLYLLTQPGAVDVNFSISGYAINQTTGLLTAVPGSPLTLPANTTPVTVTVARKAQ
jgi:6-phosphogluconolactonase